MASGDAKRTIELVFEGVDKTGAATQAAIRNTEKFAGNVQTATQPIADFTGAAVKLEAGLLAAGVALTVFSVSAASDFQSALADLSKVLSETDSIEQYRDLALELSEAYGVSATAIVESIATYKQAGFSAKEAGELTKSGLDLVIAGGVDAAKSSDLLTASIKGFGTEASTASTIVDLLNQVSNEYAASTDQLLEGFSTLSPVAKAAGLSLQETVGILTPGIEVFQSGSEVANALRTSLLRLVDDSKPVQEGLAALGVSQKDANGELRSARDIYFDVAEALQGVDKNQKLYIASQLVGIQRSSQFLAITDGLDKTLRIAGDGFDYLGSAAKEVAIQLGTAENATERAKTAFKNLFIVVGTPILDEYTGIADAIIGIFAAMGAEVRGGGLDTLVEYVESTMAEIEATLSAVAANLPAALEQADLSGFTDGLDAIKDAFSGLFDGIDLTSVDGLTSAIELAGAAFNGLSQFVGGVIESFEPLFQYIVDLSGEVSGLNPELFKTAGELAGFATQANILSGALVSGLPALEALAAIFAVNQATSLAAGIGSATAALAGGSGLLALLGKAGLVGAAGAAGVAVGTLANKSAELATGTSISTWLVDLLADIGILDDEAGKIAASINDISTSTKSLNDTPLDIGGGFGDLGKSVDQFAESAGKAEQKLFDLAAAGGKIENVTPLYDLATGEVIGYGEGVKRASESTKDLANQGDAAGASLSLIQGGLSDTGDAAKDLNTAIESLSIDEKLALIAANTAITTASIEADASKTIAAFESINNAVSATSENIDSLFGKLGDDGISKLDKFKIKDQIEKENEVRDEQLKKQGRLIEAQIREAKARADALKSGGSLITINGDGLQPHLEAFMFEILESIQIRVNAEGAEFLLGTG